MFPPRLPCSGVRATLALLALLALGTACLLALGCRSAERLHEREKEGIELFSQGRMARAEQVLRDVFEADPGRYQAARLLALIYERAGQTARALEVLERLVAARPDLGLGLMELADLYQRLRLFDRALPLYEKAGATLGYPLAYVRMAAIYRARGEDGRAERALLTALRLQPTHPEARYDLATLYESRGLHEAARTQWEAFVAVAHRDPQRARQVAFARRRLLELGARLATEDARALIASARRLLRPPAAGRLAPEDAPRLPPHVPPALERTFPGRVFLTVYPEDRRFPPLRGRGSGPTLFEALADAVLDARRSRTWALYFGPAVDRVTIVVELERAEPVAFDPDDPGQRSEFVPGQAGLELVLDKDRSAWRTPTELVQGGLAGLAPALGVLERSLGLPPGGWRSGTVRRIATTAYTEAGPGGAPVRLRDGLAERPLPTRADAFEVARAAARHLVGRIEPSGGLGHDLDPVHTRLLPPPSTATRWRVVGALALAGTRLGDPSLRTAARVLAATLPRPETATAELRYEAAIACARLGDTRRLAALRPSVLAALHDTDAPSARGLRAALALEGAPGRPETPSATARLRPPLRDLVQRALPRLDEAAHRGDPDAIAVLRAVGAPLPSHEGWPALADSAPLAQRARRLEALALLAAPAARLQRATRALWRLQLDAANGFALADRRRALGAFRAGTFDPRVRARDTATALEALLVAAPRLPQRRPDTAPGTGPQRTSGDQ